MSIFACVHTSTRGRPSRRALSCGVYLLILAALLAMGCESATKAADKPSKKKGGDAALIEVAPARDGELVVERSYYGLVKPVMEARIAAGATGEVRDVKVRVGSLIKRGETLITIDEELADAQLKEALAAKSRVEEQRDQARRDVERAERLGPEIRPEAEVERLRSELRTLEAQIASLDANIRSAREQLSRHRVRAPFDGIVSSRLTNPGDWVSPGTPVLEVVDSDEVEVLISASPSLLDNVETGKTAVLRRNDMTVPATVAGVVSALEQRTRTIKLRLVPDEAAPWLIPGQVVDGVFSFSYSVDGAIIVPRDAIVPGAAGDRVFIARDGEAVAADIKVLERTADEALVMVERGSISIKDMLVVRGNERLRPQQPVRIAEGDDDAKKEEEH